MRIANYLRPDCVALRQRADSLTGAVQQMVTLLNGTDNLTDTAVFAADVRARLALGGVCVGNGLAIPQDAKDVLLTMTPGNYIGIAAQLAKAI